MPFRHWAMPARHGWMGFGRRSLIQMIGDSGWIILVKRE
jgi:hypothetical protein